MKHILSLVLLTALSHNAAGLNAMAVTPNLSHEGYCNLEHQQIGDTIILKGLENNQLKLPNGMTLSYGEIVMYAGDFFGNPDVIISSCKDAEREACFLKHFDTLAGQVVPEANCHSPQHKIGQLKPFLKQLDYDIEQARINDGLSKPEFYQKHADDLAKKFNQLTCGGSFITPLFPLGDYIILATQNLDHFAPDAHIAYLAGHINALKTAKLAHDLQSREPEKAAQMFTLAYAKNAFATHFLSDAFAAGHLRVPRRALVHFHHLPDIITLMIANLMHHEDGPGLMVHNKNDDHWWAVGDSFLFEPNASYHRYYLTKAMQISADAIFETFQTGALPDDYQELALVPEADDIIEQTNTSPLFKEEEGHVLKRKENFLLYDKTYVNTWLAIETLIAFKQHKQTPYTYAKMR